MKPPIFVDTAALIALVRWLGLGVLKLDRV
jgi:hypothetical protein